MEREDGRIFVEEVRRNVWRYMCDVCGKTYSPNSEFRICPNCGTNLVMKRIRVIFPLRRKDDYHRFKYGVEGDYENEYYIEPE